MSQSIFSQNLISGRIRETALPYPTTNFSKTEQKAGYVFVTADETGCTMHGDKKVYDPATAAWAAGDTFTLTSRPKPEAR